MTDDDYMNVDHRRKRRLTIEKGECSKCKIETEINLTWWGKLYCPECFSEIIRATYGNKNKS